MTLPENAALVPIIGTAPTGGVNMPDKAANNDNNTPSQSDSSPPAPACTPSPQGKSINNKPDNNNDTTELTDSQATNSDTKPANRKK